VLQAWRMWRGSGCGVWEGRVALCGNWQGPNALWGQSGPHGNGARPLTGRGDGLAAVRSVDSSSVASCAMPLMWAATPIHESHSCFF
jgi:hypothetical protein